MVQQILKDQDNSRKYRLRLVLTTFVDFRKVLVQKVIQMIQATVALLTIKHEGILLHCVKYARIRFSLTWVKRANLKTYVTRKQSTPNFLEKTISYPMIRKRICAYQGVKNVCFSENLNCLLFSLPAFCESPFCLITNIWRSEAYDTLIQIYR